MPLTVTMLISPRTRVMKSGDEEVPQTLVCVSNEHAPSRSWSTSAVFSVLYHSEYASLPLLEGPSYLIFCACEFPTCGHLG